MATSYFSDWWQRDGLRLLEGNLSFADIDPARLATALKAPVFLYDATHAPPSSINWF